MKKYLIELDDPKDPLREVTEVDEDWCYAFSHSANSYPLPFCRCGGEYRLDESRPIDLRFHVAGGDWFSTFQEVLDFYEKGMRKKVKEWILVQEFK